MSLRTATGRPWNAQCFLKFAPALSAAKIKAAIINWLAEPQRSGERRLVDWRGLEPRTNALKGHCSTN